MARFFNFIGIVMAFLVSVIAVGCDSGNNVGDRATQLEQKVITLEFELKKVHEARNEEQVAIMSYILFVDSLEKKMNSIILDYTLLSNNEELRTRDRKRSLLQQLNMIQEKINSDKKRIEDLENRIVRMQHNDNNSALVAIIERYKKERRQMETKIIELHSKISDLQQRVVEKEATIKRQNIVIEKQHSTIKSKDETIAQQQASLNANYVLLVGRDTFFKVEVKNNELIIPQKKWRVNLLNDYNNRCRLSKIDSNLSLLEMDDQLWDEIRYLVVEVKGDF